MSTLDHTDAPTAKRCTYCDCRIRDLTAARDDKDGWLYCDAECRDNMMALAERWKNDPGPYPGDAPADAF